MRTDLTDDEWNEISKQLRRTWPDAMVKEYHAGRAGTLHYIDARDIMDELDDVVGPSNWETRFAVWDAQSCAVYCTLTIHGVSRGDVGYPNARVGALNKEGERIDSDEPYKDACTDAFKRACVQFGIGRFLYQERRKSANGGSRTDTSAAGGGQPPTPKQLEYLRTLANGAKLDLDATNLTKADASTLIEGIKAQGGGFTHPRVRPQMPGDAAAASAGLLPFGPHPGNAPIAAQTPSSGRSTLTASQHETIVKLSRLLDLPAPDSLETWERGEASQLIAELSAQVNARKQEATR